jgi:hypothetical protein
MRKFIRLIGLFLARVFGSRVTDFQTGRPLDKALIFPWRGKIHVIGLKKNVRVMFQPQTRLTYWKQTIAFTTHAPPDFPRETGEKPSDHSQQSS